MFEQKIDEFPLGERVRYFRKKRGFTQVELAEACEISQGALAQIEKSYVLPSIGTLKLISKKLDVHIATFFATDEVHVFDVKKLKRDYKTVSDLTEHMKKGLRKVLDYADHVGFQN